MEFGQSDKVLFVFSDPGGAKPLLAFIAMKKLKNYRVISDRTYSFYKDFDIVVKPYDGNVGKEVRLFRPDIIFTATSYTSNIEKEFLVFAKQQNIPCITFVDHWTNIAARFVLGDKSIIYPNEIWVLDKRARQIAITEGLPEKLVHISGNPYHSWLEEWKPETSKADFFRLIGIEDINTKLLLYAPDPLSNVNGRDKYGFDEITATQDLCNFKIQDPEAFKNWKVLVKTHPNQDQELLKAVIGAQEGFIFADLSIDTNTCLHYADIILGYHSSILLEGRLLGKQVVRYIPAASAFDPLKEENVGSVISGMSDMKKFIK
jgi:hypothetical protein